MDLTERIKANLENAFKIGFNVKHITEKTIDKYSITLLESELEYFKMDVEIRTDVRFTITSKPSKYGAAFLNAINKSKEKQRKLFCEYWTSLSIENNDLKVFINEQIITPDQFISDKTNWTKFLIRFTKAADFTEFDDKAYTYLTYINAICAMQLSLLDYEVIYPEEKNHEFEGYAEGSVNKIYVNRYERDPRNRMLCLFEKGYNCEVCGFNFFERYGAIGKDYIEVHHLIPVSKMGADYIVDPIKDLAPLCSNCHSMIHKKDPPYTIEELRSLINSKIDK